MFDYCYQRLRQRYTVKSTIFNMLNSTRHIQNDSLDDMDDKKDATILGFSPEYDTFPIVLAIFIVALNSFILFLTAKVRSLHTMTNFFLSSLALSDFLNGVLGIPFYLACSAIQETPICGITQVLTKFFSISIVLHLLLVSIDRHVAVVHAIHYRPLVTKTRTFYLLLSVWIIALFFSLIQLSWIGLDVDVNEDGEEKTAKINLVYNIVCIVLFFAVPLITMTFCYVSIFLALRQQLRAIQQNNVGPSSRKERRSRARERRAAFIFVVMITIYIFCWLPYFMLDFQHQFGNDFFTLPITVEYTLFYYPKFLNSLLNPLLYVLCKHDFRQAIRAVIGRTLTDDEPSLSLQNTYGRSSRAPSHKPARENEEA
ncbi:histamine H2 receptor-like [Oculina patagonica]